MTLLSDSEVAVYTQQLFSGSIKADALSKCLLHRHLRRSIDEIDDASLVFQLEKLKKEGPRQVCQYQFRKNDIVW